MSLWLLLVISWCGGVSLQHIEDAPETQRTFMRYPLTGYNREIFEESPYNDDDFYRNEDDAITYYPANGAFNADENIFGNYNIDSDMREIDPNRNQRRAANLIDSDQTLYSKADTNQNVSAFSLEPPQILAETFAENNFNDIDNTPKRSFSPWGGKRSARESSFDRDRYTWSWKRTPSKESNMPKRVRFSPWGGKRSSHVIFKPNKATRVIYTSLTPEMWLDRSNTKSQELNALPFKSNRMKYRLLKFKRGEYNFLNNKRLFYEDHHNLLKMPTKDGKRKIKFSAWGGKRSPPVIGPVWRPATDSDNSLLNSIALFSDESTNNGRLKL